MLSESTEILCVSRLKVFSYHWEQSRLKSVCLSVSTTVAYVHVDGRLKKSCGPFHKGCVNAGE